MLKILDKHGKTKFTLQDNDEEPIEKEPKLVDKTLLEEEEEEEGEKNGSINPKKE